MILGIFPRTLLTFRLIFIYLMTKSMLNVKLMRSNIHVEEWIDILKFRPTLSGEKIVFFQELLRHFFLFETLTVKN